MPSNRLPLRVFLLLLVVAVLFGGNHIGARIAFDHGVDVASAVAVRSLGTAAVVWLIVLAQGGSWRLTARHRLFLPVIALLITAQSLLLFGAVARLPVVMALLAFNTYPLWSALWDALIYRQRPPRPVLLAMPVILLGLGLALDVSGASTGLDMAEHWASIGAGVAMGLGAAATFSLAMILTQHEAADVNGRVRTVFTMTAVGVLAWVAAQAQGGMQWPDAAAGWWGLLALTVLYGTAFTVMFTVLPRLGVVGHSPILNVEPVAAMTLAWLILGQAMAPLQVAGAFIVVAAVMALGLRRH